MKKIKNVSELKVGQDYFIEAKFRIDIKNNYPYIFDFNDSFEISLDSNLKLFPGANEPFTIYEKSEMQPLEICKEYEFSEDGKVWEVGTLNYYSADCGLYRHIRPIQQSDEEREAIKLLKNLGYKIEK